MSNLITVTNQTMTSFEIASLTGKSHADVLRDIENKLKKLGPNFGSLIKSTTYKDKKIYLLSKRATLILTSGYSVTQRAEILERWWRLAN